MTNETFTPDSQEAQIAAASANTTVFSDGSTFDYENGYQSNGAPVATRDRTENPKIVKSHKIFTLSHIMWITGFPIILSIPFFLAMAILSDVQRTENINALKDGINNSGEVKVVQMAKDGVIVSRPDGSVFKCDVSVISKDTVPTGLVFCAAGGPATFQIPLPHDPNNVFYDAPDEH